MEDGRAGTRHARSASCPCTARCGQAPIRTDLLGGGLGSDVAARCDFISVQYTKGEGMRRTGWRDKD